MTNTQALSDLVRRDLEQRSEWERRQDMYYRMRHHGLRRRSKPWANAADMHFPLSDTLIEKLKPFYVEQLFATDTVASFTALEPENMQLATAVSLWFDFILKQYSNLEDEIHSAIDCFLQSGVGPVKIFWCPKEKCVQYDAIDPMLIVVPDSTKALEKSYRVCHIMLLSQEEYRQNENWRQDDEFVKRITGRDESTDTEKRISKFEREGLTYPEDRDMIVVWEIWEKQSGKIYVHTISPKLPESPVRPVFECPYEHKQMPFVNFVTEVKDKGFYSSRGVPEKVAPFETSLCKTWNQKLDAMELYNRPLFASERPIPNTANLGDLKPGSILPFAVQAIENKQPPISWDQEMTHTRMVAEQRVMVPDFGIGQTINTTDRKTATEVNALANIMSNVIDLRARLFRRSLARLYRQTFSLLVQYNPEQLMYVAQDQPMMLSPLALSGKYLIEPKGGSDGVNKQFLLTKAVNRMRMYRGDPFINQVELRRSTLILDDPNLVRKLLVDPGMGQQAQAEDQANEITYLKLGFQAAVHPADNHEIHVITVLQYIQQRVQMGAVIEPIEAQRLMEHMNLHIQALSQIDSKKASDLSKLLAAVVSPKPAPPQEAAMPAM